MSDKYGGYTDAQLHAAFDKVKNSTNWKEPINRVIDEADLEVVSEAIVYFTGSLVDIEPAGPGRVRVLASGYYANIGS